MRTHAVAAISLLMAAAGGGAAHPDHSSSTQPDRRALPARTPTPMEQVELPPAEVSITIEGEHRVIRSNGLPNHETGEFPNQGNPNALRPQEIAFRVPANPEPSDRLTPARPEFGVAVNGVIFDAGTGEFWTPEGRSFGARSAWNYEALAGGVDLGIDANNAHVQPTGKYHYHGLPIGLIEKLRGDEGEDRMLLLGWAADGFPIYGPVGYSNPMDAGSEITALESSYRVRTGERPDPPEGPGGAFDGTFSADWEYVNGAGDLDECNGRFGVTPEFPEGTYYYVITEAFPSIPRFWRGAPDPSFRRGPQGGGPGGPARGAPMDGRDQQERPVRPRR